MHDTRRPRWYGKVLTTPRLTLKPLDEDDRQAFIHMHEVSAEHLKPWMAETDDSLDQVFEQMLDRSHRWERTGRMARRVGLCEDGRFVGIFAIDQIARGAFQSAYAGWLVSSEFINQDYCTEALNGMFDFAFDQEHGLALHRIQANVMPTNTPSMRVCEKLGMRIEGMAQSYLKIAGQWEDHVMHAKTLEDHIS